MRITSLTNDARDVLLDLLCDDAEAESYAQKNDEGDGVFFCDARCCSRKSYHKKGMSNKDNN